MEGESREGFAFAQENVGIALVITQQHVIAWLMLLDEMVLQQQRLTLGMGQGHLNVANLLHQGALTQGGVGFLEIAAHPLLETARLTHIENLARGIEHAIDPGCRRQFTHQVH